MAHFFYGVTEHDTPISHGRIPAHDVKYIHQILLHMVLKKMQQAWTRRLLQQCGVPLFVWKTPRGVNDIIMLLLQMLLHHFTSFDKVSRPIHEFNHLWLVDPVAEFSSYSFYSLSGLWLQQFIEVLNNLTKIPDEICCQKTGCVSTRQLALFLLLVRWSHVATWKHVDNTFHRKRGWCMQIYQEIFAQLKDNYQVCVQVIDYRRILPKLGDWSNQMWAYCGCSRDTLFFTDGKPWRLSKPGKGRATQAFAEAATANDVNLVQQAFYNGHYGFHGAKVQHVVQVDGIKYSFTCPTCHHDATMLRESSMLVMLSSLWVDSGLECPKTCTDKAYGRMAHIRSLHTDVELCTMNAVARAVALEED